MKIISAFVMATFIYKNYRPAQEKLVQTSWFTRCRMLVLWLLIGLGRLWAEYDKARWQAIRSVAYDKVVEFLNDDLPEVRAAAVFALGCFVHNTSRNNEHATAVENEVCDKLCEKCTYDGSVLVRAELAAAIQWFVIDFQSRFATICAELDRRVATQSPSSMMMIGNGTVQHGQELSKAMAAMCLSPTESELLLSDTASTASAVPPGADHHHHNSHWPASSSSAFSTLPRRKISARSGGGGGAFGNSNHHGLQPHQQQRQAPPAPSQGRRAAPANSSSASIYAILPRSASSIIPMRHLRTQNFCGPTFCGPTFADRHLPRTDFWRTDICGHRLLRTDICGPTFADRTSCGPTFADRLFADRTFANKPHSTD
ncbi:hypothetical protein niasHT_027875 [Heterodera trifolii]|uniref:Uncharacterized protein n=1 Tax=Heterodera trifolii TaxID=157864 RepID=A0ABD2KJH9_9BILA